METWFILLILISVAALVKVIIFPRRNSCYNLPPGPVRFPVIGNLIWLRRSFSEIEQILKALHSKLGPMVTLHIGYRPFIFIADHKLAHKALVQNAAVFADRARLLPPAESPAATSTTSVPFYGPTWRALRRNFTAEIVHPSRVKSYKDARKWVLEILFDRLSTSGGDTDQVQVRVADHFQYAMFCLLVLMCFGDKLDEGKICEIERVHRSRLMGLTRFRTLNFWPMLTRIVFRKRWEQFFRLLKDQQNVVVPLIRARKMEKGERLLNKGKGKGNCDENVVSYVDSLFDLQLPEEKRKLNEEEIAALCSEFLNAGTDTTSTALQWIMANLVKYPHVQEKLYIEIKGVVGERPDEEVKEEELNKMPYLKAVVLEGLRRHPPGHFVLPHAVTEDFSLDGYVIPKNASVNFMVAELGRDPRVWETPMGLKSERFVDEENGKVVEDLDITGSREIKMMPLGAGRRVWPGHASSGMLFPVEGC